jgi:exosome complex RNA-binding protein Csl4
LRQERVGRGMRRTQMKLGDIVRAKVASKLNGLIQLSIDEYRLGVIASLCSTCGTPLTVANRRPKCDGCGSVEDRKLADDFGREPIQP